MSADTKKKSELPKETEPVDKDPVIQLTAQLQEMMEGFQNIYATGDIITEKKTRRLRGAGIKTLGFIESAFRSAKTFPDFAPHYLNVTLLDGKLRDMINLMSLKDELKSFSQKAETAYLFSSDDCYKNALAYYESLKEAAKMRVPCAETALKELEPFFKSHKSKPSSSEPS